MVTGAGRTGLRRYAPIDCRAEAGSRAPQAPAGRRAAEPLDAAEDGGILSARRRPPMPADTDLDALSSGCTWRMPVGSGGG